MGAAVTGPWSLRELAGELARGTITPAEAVARSRARIAGTDAALHAWVAQDPGAPGGIPLGVKDIIDLAGLPTRCGSVLRADATPARADAAIVTAWRRAGAAPVGKTATTEFAYFAPGPTGNPAAPGHTPGGSSSGSAAAVAAGQVPLALGTQTAGSVTRPAAFCGVASLVFSHGRFPMDGVTALSPSLDSHGVFAARVADLALAWSMLTGEPEPGPGRPPRLLAWTAVPLGVVGTEMSGALAAARRRLTEAGAVVDDFPDERLIAEVTAAHAVVMAYEAARERAAELADRDRLSPQLTGLLDTGAATPDGDYQAAREVVAAARPRVADLLASYDAMLGPAAPGPAPAGLAATGDPAVSRAWQALGLPAAGVPGLVTAAGLPLGLQLVGPAGGEPALLGVACWAEAALVRP
ncbi:amidase family protein [Amycolatopsis suaedae]|uniref:Amidase n=1 Tax=Amycolatopsis suaedae TaxID=2510978 RepID=A0A4Q7J425_9PSEU|nr:amidase [Amycolatopsis suaedae]RZQ61416.1 amidase [Amycolatopsis suaedae]